MAIPLIQNVEKQDINTSIIAIRRQLEQLYNALGVTENTVVTNNIGGSDNTPLGTIVSYLGTTNPANGEWLICDGSTFDASQYPSLATFLGGNVLPEVFDHSRPSDYEDITISTSSSSPTVMQYDGFLNIEVRYSSSSANKQLYINGVAIAPYCATAQGIIRNGTMYEVKKGDSIYFSGGYEACQIRYYKSHKIIKAVSPTDQYTSPSTEMQQIEQYVDNGLQRNMSYSTTEQWTGGYWIDGKKIYRVAIEKQVTTSGNNSYANALPPNMAEIVRMDCCLKLADGGYFIIPQFGSSGYNGYIKPTPSTRELIISVQNYIGLYRIVIEYTKTTD